MFKQFSLFKNVSSYSPLLIGCAALLGVMTGYTASFYPLTIAHGVSHVFVNLLALISLPIIFLSIVATLSGMESFEEMKTLGRKVLKHTLFTTLIAALGALALFLCINPVGNKLVSTASAQQAIGLTHYLSFLAKIVPFNIIQALSDNGNVISVVFLALIIGIATLFLDHQPKVFLHTLFSSLFEVLLKITQAIVYIIPLGVWAFTAIFVSSMQKSTHSLQHLFLYLMCVLAANILQGAVVLPLLLKYYRLSPFKIMAGMRPALTVAFFSKSSNTTLPLTIKCAQENVGISSRVARFTLPLCATINMNGCAAFILITVLFVGQTNGMHFSLFDMISWVFIATIAAIGNAGVPMGCFFLTSALLATLGVPLEIMGVILPLYTIIDMVETTVNVWSDACVAVIVDKELSSQHSQ